MSKEVDFFKGELAKVLPPNPEPVSGPELIERGIDKGLDESRLNDIMDYLTKNSDSGNNAYLTQMRSPITGQPVLTTSFSIKQIQDYLDKLN
ncbi:hypothetical protein [Furfurilactobacillus rossiae]|uniref:Uncharacterized protein n=1 Tax=Furfurilactobacillus rossiae DSM 15814 TaxID=1114972 RepID=A0A0R1RIW6_9LACO|nr:hypothetical protein [Furfurilactobacillus rossiae]KRL56662.1 hypothetical protein FD35_GL001761 [Furfurilactobacillus rossiae DSM 15814]QFR66437.1 hypothetical protein LR814_04720 [Furfurilactobacillus rossiae]QLE61894.1 hypothetical protein LROSRS0_1849 [Furfurilactobacillus rossiae]